MFCQPNFVVWVCSEVYQCSLVPEILSGVTPTLKNEEVLLFVGVSKICGYEELLKGNV